MRAREQADRGGLAAALGRITDATSRLMSEHLALARIELREDARALGLAAVRVAVFVPLIVVGYAFVCGAVSVALGMLIGFGWALLVVGLLNVIVGSLGAYVAAAHFQGREMLDETRVEVSRSAEALAAAGRPEGPERRLEA
jgi:Putative Actinobacterial Holin-X, holin superfamily III